MEGSGLVLPRAGLRLLWKRIPARVLALDLELDPHLPAPALGLLEQRRGRARQSRHLHRCDLQARRGSR